VVYPSPPAQALSLSDPCLVAPLEVGPGPHTVGSAYSRLAWEGSLVLDVLPIPGRCVAFSRRGLVIGCRPPLPGASPHSPCPVRRRGCPPSVCLRPWSLSHYPAPPSYLEDLLHFWSHVLASPTYALLLPFQVICQVTVHRAASSAYHFLGCHQIWNPFGHRCWVRPQQLALRVSRGQRCPPRSPIGLPAPSPADASLPPMAPTPLLLLFLLPT
jgi:hypothetical protein